MTFCLFTRSFHSAPPLEIDEQVIVFFGSIVDVASKVNVSKTCFQLCASAQYWANLLAHRDEYQHQSPEDPGFNPEVGENLFTWPVVPVAPAGPEAISKKRLAESARYGHEKYSHFYMPRNMFLFGIVTCLTFAAVRWPPSGTRR